MSDHVQMCNYVPQRCTYTSGDDVLGVYIYDPLMNHLEKINPPMKMDWFMQTMKLNQMNAWSNWCNYQVIIVHPMSWQNINKWSCCKTKLKQRGGGNNYYTEVLNVGPMHDYVYLRHEHTKKLLHHIYGSNSEIIDSKSMYSLESNNFRISVINGNIRIIIVAGVQYLIFRFLVPYYNTNTNKFEALFCIASENRPNQRQHWQCVNIVTKEELMDYFESVIKTIQYPFNNSKMFVINSQLMEELFLPPKNPHCDKEFYSNVPFDYLSGLRGKRNGRIYKLLSAINECLKYHNHNHYYQNYNNNIYGVNCRINKHVRGEFEDILTKTSMSEDDLIDCIYEAIERAEKMARVYGRGKNKIVATQQYIDKRARIYYELVLLLELRTSCGIYQFGLALMESKMASYDPNNCNIDINSLPKDHNDCRVFEYEAVAILTTRMVIDNVLENNSILSYYYYQFQSERYNKFPAPGFIEWWDNKYPNESIPCEWVLDLRSGARRVESSYYDNVGKRRKQKELQQLESVKTFNSANNRVNNVNMMNGGKNNNVISFNSVTEGQKVQKAQKTEKTEKTEILEINTNTKVSRANANDGDTMKANVETSQTGAVSTTALAAAPAKTRKTKTTYASVNEIIESVINEIRRARNISLMNLAYKIGAILYRVYPKQDASSLLFALAVRNDSLNSEEKEEKAQDGCGNGVNVNDSNENKVIEDICQIIGCHVGKNISEKDKVQGFWNLYLAAIDKFKNGHNGEFIDILTEQLKEKSKQTKQLCQIKEQFKGNDLNHFKQIWQFCETRYKEMTNAQWNDVMSDCNSSGNALAVKNGANNECHPNKVAMA